MWTPKTMRSLARKYCEGGYAGVKCKQAKQDHLRNLSLKFDLGATKCECNLCG